MKQGMLLRMEARKMLNRAGVQFCEDADIELLAADIAAVAAEEGIPIADVVRLLERRIGQGNLDAYLSCLRINLAPRPKRCRHDSPRHIRQGGEMNDTKLY